MSQTPQPPRGRRRRKDEESQTYQPALFEELITEDYGHKVRRRWYQDRWWFSILDIIAIAADTTAPGKYWYALKQRMEKEQGFQSTLAQIEVLRIPAKDGRLRETDMATDETILRILQSVPHPRVESVRLWLSKVGSQRLAFVEHPEQMLEEWRNYYRRLGRSEEWIEKRLVATMKRNALTDEWMEREVGQEHYAALTNEIHEGTFEITIAAHKTLKGLSLDTDLRDHSSELELLFISLGETTARAFHQRNQSTGYDAVKADAQAAGATTGKLRKEYEADTGLQVVTPDNFIEQDRRTGRRRIKPPSIKRPKGQ